MNRSIILLMLLAAVVTLGCGRGEDAAAVEETATIGRPEPKPGELGTDALTQTVELEDGRSEDEGGVVTNPNPQVRVSSPEPPPLPTETATTGTSRPPQP